MRTATYFPVRHPSMCCLLDNLILERRSLKVRHMMPFEFTLAACTAEEPHPSKRRDDPGNVPNATIKRTNLKPMGFITLNQVQVWNN